MLFNIHTHNPLRQGNFELQNLHRHFESMLPNNYYSMGIHPWYIDSSNYHSDWEKIMLFSLQKNVLAIGECGLDRICNSNFQLQEKIFIDHIRWANEIGKPLIIHCVKSHREILSLLQQQQNKMPVIFHGYNNNLDWAKEIVIAGHYLSFGPSLLTPRMEPIFSSIPLNHIFLETDNSELYIEDLYKKAASIKNVSIEQLTLQLEENFDKIFKIKSIP